jgi:uncharacterized protein (DUF2252 family)
MDVPMQALLDLQLAVDAQRLKGREKLLDHKYERMSASPFSFLRGAVPLWAEALRREKALEGLPGEGTLVGDLHLENYGTFFTGDGFIFHVNDFDEAHTGPWAYDVLRLLTSIELSAEQKGLDPKKPCREALDGYCSAEKPKDPPHSVVRLLKHAQGVGMKKLYAKRLASSTKLAENDRQPPAPPQVVEHVPRALELWRRSLPTDEAPSKKSIEVLDVRRRITGCGSLGVERVVVLTAGDKQGPWIIDVKAARGCVAADVVEALRRCLPAAPYRFGAGELGAATVMVHPLAPGEEKIDATALGANGFEHLCRYAGILAADVHHRGASGDFKAWGHGTQKDVLDRAARLAAVHREAYAVFVKRWRKK